MQISLGCSFIGSFLLLRLGQLCANDKPVWFSGSTLSVTKDRYMEWIFQWTTVAHLFQTSMSASCLPAPSAPPVWMKSMVITASVHQEELAPAAKKVKS